MADKKQDRRLATLKEWASRAAAAGFQVPADVELEDIAANPVGWRNQLVSRIPHAWAATIDHLMKQAQFGVAPAYAVDQLPQELTAPDTIDEPPTAPPRPDIPEPPPVTPDVPTRPTAVDPNAAIVDELMRWRTSRIAEGVDGADRIRDITLKNLVKFNHTAVETIAKKVPEAPHLAPEIAAIIAGTAGGDQALPTAVIEQPKPEPVRAAPTSDAPDRDDAPKPPAPVAEPVVDTATVQSRHSRSEDPVLHLDHGDFCEYEYGDSDVTPSTITIRSTPDGVRLTFEPFTPERGKMVLYRVVSGEDVTPYKPEAGEIVAVTTALHVDDNRYPTSAVRTYQVWCHVGVDQEGACRSQPFLLAKGEQVSPVEDFAITEDEGRVIGQWSVFPGTRAVRVYRIPLSGPSASSERNDPRNQICADEANLTGFVDRAATRGTRYLYRALAEVAVDDSVRQSRPKQQDILVSVVLQGVNDLDVTIAEDNSQFDLSWTTPAAGQVRIYRLNSAPPAGLEGTEIDEAALRPQGFVNETRINFPVTAAGPTTSRMAGVPWPTTFDRAYLVPVTVLNGKACFGTVQVKARPLPPVSNAEIVERFDAEIATFAWPKGAVQVLAFVGPESLPPEEICGEGNQPMAEITEAVHRRDGGLTFERPLPAKGCNVCLVPVSYSRGYQVRGAVTTVAYPGLSRVWYELELQQVPSRHVVQLRLYSELEVDSPIAFVLINNADRFPLSPDDGQPVYLKPPLDTQEVPQCLFDRLVKGHQSTGWSADLTQFVGYVRLFIAERADTRRRFALKDPALETLRRIPIVGTP
jgi:hypothetical protein